MYQKKRFKPYNTCWAIINYQGIIFCSWCDFTQSTITKISFRLSVNTIFEIKNKIKIISVINCYEYFDLNDLINQQTSDTLEYNQMSTIQNK